MLYKLPLAKRSWDLEWRILHGALPTNDFLSELVANVVEGCVFCNMLESMHQVFLEYRCILSLLSSLSTVRVKIRVCLSEGVYVLWPM